jgi:hypothetical protein
MKAKHYFYGSLVSAVLACVCAAPARHYASRAYALWLSQDATALRLSDTAARVNHLWAGTMVGFAVLAGVLLVAGWWSRRARTIAERPS